MMRRPTTWLPCPVEEIQDQLGDFEAWCLCGGQSLDWIAGRTTRQHGDTDIGVFRSDLKGCLEAIGRPRVYLCEPPGEPTLWTGGDALPRVHDIWIADPLGECWILQIMVYDDSEDQVVYRRDPRISWRKDHHVLTVRGMRVLNPVISMLFKTNRSELEDKDCRDIQVLIEEVAKQLNWGMR